MPESATHLPSNIEFSRHSFILVPAQNETPFKAVFVAPLKKTEKSRMFCTCKPGTYATCKHAEQLTLLCAEHVNSLPHLALPQSRFASLLMPLARQFPRHLKYCRIEHDKSDNTVHVIRDNQVVIHYYSQNDDRDRFVSRMTIDNTEDTRAVLMSHAESLVLSELERIMASRGEGSTKQAEENSFWYRLLYHLHREFENADITISPLVDEESGRVWITIKHNIDNSVLVKLSVPPDVLGKTLDNLYKNSRLDNTYSLLDKEVEIHFAVSIDNVSSTISFTPCIPYNTKHHKQHYNSIDTRFIYGNLIYLPTIKTFQRLSTASLKVIANHWKNSQTIPLAEAGAFIKKHCDSFSFASLDQGGEVLDLFLSGGDDLARLYNIKIIRSFDGIELVPLSMTADSCTLTATYVSKEADIPLTDILAAHTSGNRFLVSSGCIVDLKTIPLTRLYNTMAKTGKKGGIRLPRSSLMQLSSAGAVHLKIDKSKPWAAELQNMLDLKPVNPLDSLKGYKSTLRNYQHTGISWLLFLCDNGFGGLLCDDMGLGKTHQILGLFCALREQRKNTAPFIVICPTTVIPHWQRLVETFAPGITITSITGTSRDWTSASTADLVLTTYGTLRADASLISDIRFGLAVFDEAQYIKNPATQVCIAARGVNASVKICMTGTPIENSVFDLKSLFDLVMPNFLGAHEDFLADFAAPIEERGDMKARENLKKLTAPFILRRLKKSVLTDLPSKIDDIRFCDMTNEQASLYHSLVEKRGSSLLSQLRNEDEPVPYMHIFALLNTLKQACDHPALLTGKPADFDQHESGKWDLFVELLDEILGSGQKVVVYSQYLDMIEIIRLYLERIKIGAVVLTGESRNRGDLIKRFSEDDACKVFIGSLKASGAGIDLVSASTVIHYDRWWNAAREDQATDRVHRIGQKRGVVVYKLVTKNSVEEKIDKIISGRRELAEKLLAEDSPDEMKSFTREELMSILDARQ